MTTFRLVLLCACGAAFLAFLAYPVPLADKLAAIPYGIDPQRPSHTYIVGGVPLPLEARKTGMFGGFLLASLFLLARGRRRAASFPPWPLMALLVACFASLACDGLNATFFDLGWPHLYTPSLQLRLATGLLAGLAMAAVLLPAVNGVLWRAADPAPSIASGTDVLGTVIVLGAFFLLVDARLPILYDAIAIVSIAGLVIELALINVVLVLAVSRRMGAATSLWDVVPIAAAGLCLTAAELLFMSIIRYLVLGDITKSM